MFFENQDFSASVTDVLSFNEHKRVAVPTSARTFCALSYRNRAETYFETSDGIVEAGSRCIALFPAGIEYVRVTESENMTVIHFKPTIELGNRIKTFYPGNYLEYEKYFDKILKVWQRKETAYKIKCNEYLMRLVHMICCEQDNSAVRNIAVTAAGIIEKNLTDSTFGVGSIAETLNISGAYLRRKFSEEYGISPCAYLAEKRMEKAVTLLETNYFTVKEVALRCGFENEKYFATVFRKNYGIPPSKYK